MIAEFALTVLYAQIIVDTGEASGRGLLWTDDHVAQGFAWSRGHVTFGMPDHDGQVLVQVDTIARPKVDAAALWAVQVPFEALSTPLEIGTVLDERTVPVPAGRYDLLFETLPGATFGGHAYAYVVKLRFSRSEAPTFKILKQGDELTTNKVLREDAEPAQ